MTEAHRTSNPRVPTPHEIMTDCHFGMCDDFPRGRAYADGALDTMLRLGLITYEQHRLWDLALKSCPGHRDGGRAWCAYCGDLPDEIARVGGLNGE